MQARRSSLYRKVEEASGPVTYFQDDFSTGTDGNLAGQAASHIGSWIAAPSSPSYIEKVSLTYIRSVNANSTINYVEAVPGAGLSFDHDHLRVKSLEQRVLDNKVKNLLAVSLISAAGDVRSGVRINFYNPTAATGVRLQVIWYNASRVAQVVFSSGDTDIPSFAYYPLEIVAKRLSGNTVETTVSVNNNIYDGPRQFVVEPHIFTQNSILVELRNKDYVADSIFKDFLVDNQNIHD